MTAILTPITAMMIKTMTIIPFGLATICYMGLASLLNLVCKYAFKITVNNRIFRRSVKKSVHERTNLLDTIETAKMKHNAVSMIMNKARMLAKIGDEKGIEPFLEESELKQYIKVAIKEAKSAKKKL